MMCSKNHPLLNFCHSARTNRHWQTGQILPPLSSDCESREFFFIAICIIFHSILHQIPNFHCVRWLSTLSRALQSQLKGNAGCVICMLRHPLRQQSENDTVKDGEYNVKQLFEQLLFSPASPCAGSLQPNRKCRNKLYLDLGTSVYIFVQCVNRIGRQWWRPTFTSSCLPLPARLLCSLWECAHCTAERNAIKSEWRNAWYALLHYPDVFPRESQSKKQNSITTFLCVFPSGRRWRRRVLTW